MQINGSFVMVCVSHHRCKTRATILPVCELYRFNELCNLNRLCNIVMVVSRRVTFVRWWIALPYTHITLNHTRLFINMYGRSTSTSRFREFNDWTCLLLWKLNAWSVINTEIYVKIERVLHFFCERLSQGEIIAHFYRCVFLIGKFIVVVR